MGTHSHAHAGPLPGMCQPVGSPMGHSTAVIAGHSLASVVAGRR